MDLHAWITAKVTETEDAAQATLVGRRATFQPHRDGRATTGTITAATYGPDGLNLVLAQRDVQPVDDVPAPVQRATAVLRRCEADRRILARHNVNPAEAGSWSHATACHGCGTYGDCDDPETENLNDCPELLDLAHAHGLTKGDLDGLDRPQPPEPKSVIANSRSLAQVLGIPAFTPMGALPSALRGPAWGQRHG